MKYKIQITCIQGQNKDQNKKWKCTLVDRKSIVIGRLAGCHIVLQDTKVSKSHCLIQIQKDKLVIIDLGSQHGTQINIKAVQAAKLYNNDNIKLGNTILNIKYKADH
ncbi:MAG: FHA domain-containing protein [Planctomycetes bacterium]|jgi:pSer/pThr/pTyr-binding forkhead associated (FHA) protein|nr:FHA domain-containing protein [Planctomycetota bacterium]HPY74447.1 FHA domain-containing protein [Planctomycetota bacterium]HQA99998.1 FHA domain-containing protein [Planctomycetota bacterium]